MLRRRSIRLRIIVLVLVPVVTLLAMYAEVLNLTVGNLLTLRQEAAIRQLVAIPVAHVQTQLARERTLALQYLARQSGDLTGLLAQEHRTDVAIKSFRGAVTRALRSGPVPKERQALLSWRARLSRINELRTAVVSLGLTKIAATDAYSTLLTEGDDVLHQAIVPVLSGPIGVQATDILTMAKVAQTVGKESDLLRADLIDQSFPAADLMLINQLAVLHQDQWSQTLPQLDPVLRSYFKPIVAQGAQLAGMESQIAAGPAGARQVSLPTWTSTEESYQQGFLKALLKSAATLSAQALSQAQSLAIRLGLIAGIGLLAICACIGIGFFVGRGLVRQLSELRQSAVKLSTEQLPGAIGRLRAGEDVDVSAEVPRLQPSSDEIGQVKEAFNTAARTAIIAAADEVRIRRGVNDVFRSLARRNQSLLTRQLQLLDSMERRVHDPEELADLFRVDHMTTRMRRHAEGLLIVAGGSSGRSWREPVPIVDVMRAAAAEVEDYTRIRVTSRTGAALAGHAVADIIHLLAELVENAATFSPASTPVRVDGEKVARGVVVEIEDRGLGMGDEQLAVLNATLADPPLFDLSGSDQLGLFIAGQLAKRHDVKVTLRSSAYGGITAVVLIPRELIVETGEPEEPLPIAGIRELGGRPLPELPGVLDVGRAVATIPHAVADAAPYPGLGTVLPGQQAESDPLAGPLAMPAAASEPDAWTVAASVQADDQAVADLPRRQPGTTGLSWNDDPGARWSGSPASWAGNGAPAAADAAVAEPAAAEPAAAEPAAAQPAAAEPGQPAAANGAAAATGLAGPQADHAAAPPDGTDALELDGLPVRVRQANLAPQLRQQAQAVSSDTVEPAAGPSPEAARSTMAALQLGWQRGRTAGGSGGSSPQASTPGAAATAAGASSQDTGDPPDEGGAT